MNYAFITGKILDGTKDMEVQEELCILTNGKKIVDIVPAGSDLNGYEKVELGGKYILPGLINMHVHLSIINGLKNLCKKRQTILLACRFST